MKPWYQQTLCSWKEEMIRSARARKALITLISARSHLNRSLELFLHRRMDALCVRVCVCVLVCICVFVCLCVRRRVWRVSLICLHVKRTIYLIWLPACLIVSHASLSRKCHEHRHGERNETQRLQQIRMYFLTEDYHSFGLLMCDVSYQTA